MKCPFCDNWLCDGDCAALRRHEHLVINRIANEIRLHVAMAEVEASDRAVPPAGDARNGPAEPE